MLVCVRDDRIVAYAKDADSLNYVEGSRVYDVSTNVPRPMIVAPTLSAVYADFGKGATMKLGEAGNPSAARARLVKYLTAKGRTLEDSSNLVDKDRKSVV